MHRKLKQSKSDKMDKVLDLLAINLKHTMPGNNQVHKSAEEDTIEDELDAAMKGLCDDSSDVELILPPDIEKKDKSFQEEKKQAIEPVFTRQSVVETTSPAIFSNHDSRRKIHGFIDELTSNDAINDEDKQEICLAIYHVSLSKDVCLYLESLLSTRKSLADIARNLLWFINCLKKREDKL